MQRMSMRRVRDCLRLKSAGISAREITRRLGVASSSVRMTLRRCNAADIFRPLASDISDAALAERLFANSGTKQGHWRHAEPDWDDSQLLTGASVAGAKRPLKPELIPGTPIEPQLQEHVHYLISTPQWLR